MPENIKSLVEQAWDLAPFICTVGGKPSMNTSRILEAFIIFVGTGVVSAFIFMYVFLQVLDVKFDNLEKQMTSTNNRIEKKVDKLYDDYYKPLTERSAHQ